MIGQFGLGLPSFPIYAESPHSSCEHSLYLGKRFQLSKIELILNKANAIIIMFGDASPSVSSVFRQ